MKKIEILQYTAKHWSLTPGLLRIFSKDKNIHHIYDNISFLVKQGYLAKKKLITGCMSYSISVTTNGMRYLDKTWLPETFKLSELNHNQMCLKTIKEILTKEGLEIKPESYLSDRELKGKLGKKAKLIPDFEIMNKNNETNWYEVELTKSSIKEFRNYFNFLQIYKKDELFNKLIFYCSADTYKYLHSCVLNKLMVPEYVEFHQLSEINL